MVYSTNTVEMDLAAAGGDQGDFIIEITPNPGYASVVYDITVKEGATVLQSWTGLSGNQTRTYSTLTDKDVQIYVTSNQGMLYACKLSIPLFSYD